jgi:hypothetical protein
MRHTRVATVLLALHAGGPERGRLEVFGESDRARRRIARGVLRAHHDVPGRQAARAGEHRDRPLDGPRVRVLFPAHDDAPSARETERCRLVDVPAERRDGACGRRA